MTNRRPYLVLGAGRMGRAIARFLSINNSVAIYDTQPYLAGTVIQLEQLENCLPVPHVLEYPKALEFAFKNAACVVSALPAKENVNAARRAAAYNRPYVDLGGVDEVVESQKLIRSGAPIIPNVGLAPGLVPMIAWDLYRKSNNPTSVRMYCGGITLNPEDGWHGWTNTWSTEGLVNEYIKNPVIVENYELKTVEPLSGYEQPVTVGLNKYEAARTHGGYGNLMGLFFGCKTPPANVEYKTLRHPGHYLAVSDLLATDGGEALAASVDDPDMSDLLIAEDMVVIRVEVGDLVREIEMNASGKLTAMQIATCAPAAAVAEAAGEGHVPFGGFVPVELIDLRRIEEKIEQFGIRL